MKKGRKKFHINVYKEELEFSIERDIIESIKMGGTEHDITLQYVILKMIQEQGNAEEIPNGFTVPAEIVTGLDLHTRDILELPDIWSGTIKTKIEGQTYSSRFSVDFQVSNEEGDFTSNYKIDGPFISFGKSQKYLLSRSHYLAFLSLKNINAVKKKK